jgi:hypothetical protein
MIAHDRNCADPNPIRCLISARDGRLAVGAAEIKPE